MLKFIHIADVHIGAKPDIEKSWSEIRSEELITAFDNIIDVCRTQDADLLLIAGDLFNASPTLPQLRLIDAKLKKLRGTRTVIVAGSSDPITPDSAWAGFEFSSDTTVLPPDTVSNAYFEDINVCVTGMSYGKETYDERMLEHLTPGREGAFNILLGYGGSKGRMPFSSEKLKSAGFDYIALGNVHKPTVVEENEIIFAGSLEPLSVEEKGQHGYVYGTFVVGNDKVAPEKEITFIPCCMRCYIDATVKITSDMTTEAIHEAVLETIRKYGVQHIYTLRIEGFKNKDATVSISDIMRDYLIFSVDDVTKYAYDIAELKRENEGSILPELIDALRGEEEDEEPDGIKEHAVRYGLLALLRTGDN